MTPGTKLTHQIMLALSEAGCIVWKNPTGTAYQGRVIHKQGNTITLADPRVVTFGLCVGGSDLIGIAPDGRFLATEIKAGKDRPTREQLEFISAVHQKHGLACIARTTDDALALLARG